MPKREFPVRFVARDVSALLALSRLFASQEKMREQMPTVKAGLDALTIKALKASGIPPETWKRWLKGLDIKHGLEPEERVEERI